MASEGAAEGRHLPVLLKKVVELLRPARRDGVIVDATVGLGGHAEALLEANQESRLLGIDRDPVALKLASERLERFGSRVTLVEGRHESLIDILESQKVDEVDAVLADLGVSSMQFDEAERGFSFRYDAPLDMRMSREGATAADLLATSEEREIEQILRDYGEEPMARRIARAIVASREVEPIVTTRQLAEIVRSVKKAGRDRIDPATLTFQALRIAVNEELVGLDRFVEDAVRRLVPRGRIGVISFHSLEDRIVKRAFRRLKGECTCPPGMPVCGCGAKAEIDVLTSRPVEASDEEIDENPRSRSAKLRVAERLSN